MTAYPELEVVVTILVGEETVATVEAVEVVVEVVFFIGVHNRQRGQIGEEMD